ncbi:pimeloyl-ACP methyl ester carboxylesterase [Motilibacter rhizosphaerae]|uniref:Pimeloyl-ACP methyl ester carboxylesterase n=1 Tax=Motilibacter rhizosphaerae TaxID=598652 RepID=A0A4Q7NVL6_9ACTN|nr:alpha/beta hydrolase [Motilibacter rhizosphaerae]RZS90918.1 pimeloyl-ACP methyl ester carboxylesterase [Motilibacter rhizosphaerae]
MPDVPQLDGVRHSWVRAGDDLMLHVAAAGPEDAPPVVLLHGWPQHWWCWRHVIPPLARDHRVLAVDLRGCGWSDVPASGYDKEQLAADVVGVLDTLGVERTRLVGHDWGGWVAGLLAQRHPERVTDLLLVSILPPFLPVHVPPRQAWRFGYQPLVAAPVLGPLLVRGVAARRDGSFAEVLRQRRYARASSLLYRTFLVRELAQSRAGAHRGGPAVPWRLLLGGADPVIRPEFLLRGRQATTVLPGAGHFLPEEAPEAVLAALAAPR